MITRIWFPVIQELKFSGFFRLPHAWLDLANLREEIDEANEERLMLKTMTFESHFGVIASFNAVGSVLYATHFWTQMKQLSGQVTSHKDGRAPAIALTQTLLSSNFVSFRRELQRPWVAFH